MTGCAIDGENVFFDKFMKFTVLPSKLETLVDFDILKMKQKFL